MPRILIVSTDEKTLDRLQTLLAAGGYSVDAARGGAEALVRAQLLLPDLVVSDPSLTVSEGYPLLKFWKRDARLSAVPFIVFIDVTGGEDSGALTDEADAIVRNPEELLTRVLLQLEETKRFLQSDLDEREALEAALFAGEAELRQLTESIPQIVWIARPDGWHIHFNQRWLDYTGLTLEESLGHGWNPPIHPEDRLRASELWRNATETGTVYEIEYRLHGADGRYRWMLGRALPLRDTSGTIVKWFGTCTDIQDLKETEAEVHALQRQQQLILESVGEGIHGLDLEGRITFENPAGIAMFGWAEAEMLGFQSHGLIHHHDADGSDYPRENCPIYQTLRDGQVRRVEDEVFFRRDGSSFPVEYAASPVRDDSGSITGAVVSFRDVTEQRALAQRLEKTMTLLRIAGKVAHLGGWTLSLPERELTWSDEICIIHDRPPGYRPAHDEVITYFLPENRAEVSRLLEACEKEGTPYEFEFPKITAMGRKIWTHSIGEAVRDSEGKIVGLQGAIRDITERKAAEESLRHKDALIRMAGRVSRTGGWAVKLPEGTLSWTDETFEIVEYPGNEVPSLAEAENFYLEPSRTRVFEAIERCARDGTPFDLEAEIRTTTGKHMWVRVIAEAERNANGAIVTVQGAFQDISERKRAEQALRESENELRALAESMPQMVWMARPDGWTNYFNQQWVDSSGLTLEESYGRGWIQVVHPDDLDRAITALRQAGNGLHSFSVEGRMRHADGAYRWMLVRGIPFGDADGHIVKWIGTCTDIDDLKQTSVILREQASLLDKAQDAIIVRDLDHKILYWNRSAERVYGWTAEEVSGRSVADFLYKNNAAFEDALQTTLTKGEWVGEIEQHTKDGRTITAEGHLNLVRDDHGKPKSILAINTDITARKELELQFLRAQRLESIGTLAGGIAHDFNNLLAPIVMGVSFLKRLETRENALQIIENIERSANRGRELVKQVLSFARGVDGERVSIQIPHVMREVEFIVGSTLPKNITFERQVAPVLWSVTGDPTQLNQVILNLCVNGADAMPDGGRLAVSVQNLQVDEDYAARNPAAVPGRYVTIEVSDEGRGMPPSVLERIFEPFFTTKEKGKGTGLGLSTVLGIVKSHGGFVSVSSELGSGSTFKVHLPAGAETASIPRPVTETQSLPRGEGELILIVDDEISILNVTGRTLEEFGYRFIGAENGSEALEIFIDNQDEIAVVLTDMMMPVMDGAALIAALKNIDPDLPIIAASGLNTGINASSAGVEHFLAKPYSADRLLILLRLILSKDQAPAGPSDEPGSVSKDRELAN